MAEHSVLTDPDLHEPKGIAAATVDKVYVSDGAAGGAWKTVYNHGTEDTADLSSGTQSLTSGVFLDITNDGLGPNTISTHRIPGKTALYNTSTNEMDFTSYKVGDRVTIRVDLDFIVGSVNTVFTIAIELGLTAFSFELDTDPIYFKSTGTFTDNVVYFIFDVQDSNSLDNPGKIKVKADTSGNSVVVNGFRFFMDPKNPVYV